MRERCSLREKESERERGTERESADRLPQHRFGASSLHQRDSRSALFDGYTGDGSRRGGSPAAAPAGGYGYGYAGGSYAPNGGGGNGLGIQNNNSFRPATPNRKGQYSDAVLNELESQNDDQVAGILGKVRTLKNVSDGPLRVSRSRNQAPSWFGRPTPKSMDIRACYNQARHG